ncbi:MAG: DUF3849 domain-containing protein [Gracilibacteraceae bacterium]|nr:DUF3849 domain-containing protein [Gracilibacteraceae bacterium]
MYEDSARIADPAKIVYPYTVSQAKGRLENSCYAESARYNAECAAAIDAAIKSSCYKSDHYHLDIAAMAAIHAHGFERVNAVLAHQIRQAKSDGRYSGANKAWALLPGFDYPETALNGAYLRSHAVLINDFTDYARKLYSGLGAERFALPGCEECGTAVQGYEITRSIWFDDRRGFAIGHSPIAPAPHVCWQFTTENGKREFYWGTYGGEKEAADNYRVRIIAHMNDGDVKEIPPPLAAAKMTSEQSYDMAPESRAVVGREERLSTLAQIRAAKAAPKPPRKAKETDPHKHKNGAEL